MAEHREPHVIEGDLDAARASWSDGAPGSEALCRELEAELGASEKAAAAAARKAAAPAKRKSTSKAKASSASKSSSTSKGSPGQRKSAR